MPHQYYLKSPLFAVEPGEDNHTNPGLYGRALANWLCARLVEHGYPDAEVIAEDWGWCILCSPGDVRLWVGCGVVDIEDDADYHDDLDAIPEPEYITWSTFAVAEVSGILPTLRKWFGKLDTQIPLNRLDETLSAILNSEPEITLLDEV